MSFLERVMIILRENTMDFNFLGIKFYNVNQLNFFICILLLCVGTLYIHNYKLQEYE